MCCKSIRPTGTFYNLFFDALPIAIAICSLSINCSFIRISLLINILSYIYNDSLFLCYLLLVCA